MHKIAQVAIAVKPSGLRELLDTIYDGVRSLFDSGVDSAIFLRSPTS